MSCSMRFVAVTTCLLLQANLTLARQFLGSNEGETPAIPMLEELEKIVGSGHRTATEARIKQLEEIIWPKFLAMPKAEDGGLNPDAVRYLLHRVFVERHGWFVTGLDSAGESWNASSPADVFKQHAEDVHGLFEARLNAHTFNLHHVAVLAATLENLVNNESMMRLNAAYRYVKSFPDQEDQDLMTRVIETYMTLYVVGANVTAVTDKQIGWYRDRIWKSYPTWNDTRMWAWGVRDELLTAPDSPPAASFESAVQAVEVIGDRYGRFQDKECRDLKELLVDIEHQQNGAGTGRVKLDAFYKSALEGNWQFGESVSYLRHLGALDETDSEWPSVIIPNYINAPSNCVASSRFYSVCCINECEALLNHLEQDIAAPTASPHRIIELVAALPSASQPAPRALSEPLTRRLTEVANQYGGTVPLHGRLFAQWMHHAYPRECPYPHLSGTTKPLTSKAWRAVTGEQSRAPKEDMRWHVERASARGADATTSTLTSELPWSEEDELFLYHAKPVTVKPGSSIARKCASLAVLLCVASYLVHAVLGAGRILGDEKLDKHHFV